MGAHVESLGGAGRKALVDEMQRARAGIWIASNGQDLRCAAARSNVFASCRTSSDVKLWLGGHGTP